jgi:hypothetical protein
MQSGTGLFLLPKGATAVAVGAVAARATRVAKTEKGFPE